MSFISSIKLGAVRLWDLAAFRFVVWTAVGIVIWVFPSKGIHDVLVYGAFLLALLKAGRSAVAWKQPAGIAFIIVFLYTALTIPFSAYPALSARDLAKMLDIAAGAFAISVFFNTRERIAQALFYSAVAIACILAFDILRLYYHLGPKLLSDAHGFTPFILNHSNVASMLAGLATMVFAGCAWQWRRRPEALAGCAAGIAVCLAYMVIVASRGPQIAFALTVIGAGFILPGWRRKLIWLALIAVIGGLLAFNLERINPRFLEKATMTTFTDRNQVWEHTWKLSMQKPLFGHGFGKQIFEQVYYSTNPPKSKFHYPHAHQFWLKLLFEFGWLGLTLNLAAWLLLAVGLLRRIYATPDFADRMLPGTVALLLLFIHLYGLGDYPDNVVQLAQFWLIPVALVLIGAKARTVATPNAAIPRPEQPAAIAADNPGL